MSAARQPFQDFLDAHRRAVLSFLRAMVGPQDADDVFQETFLAALRAYRRMDGRDPRAWVLTIARRKAVDHHRARRRRPEPRAELPESEARLRAEPPASERVEGRSEAEDLWRTVGGLPSGQRAAIALRFAAGLPYSEIATALGCSEDAARRRVHDGLGALRRRIEEDEGR